MDPDGQVATPARPSHRRAWIVIGALVAATTAYFVTFAIIGYTDDAYVWSDLVAIASEVEGPIQSVSVHDNQTIETGDAIAEIDPRPFRLEVELKRSRIANLEAAVAVRETSAATDAASADAAVGAQIYAQREFDRINALTAGLAVSRADVDKLRDALRTANDRVADRGAKVLVNKREIDAAKTAVAVAKADLSLAQYNLSRTHLKATVAGYVNNLTLRPGDYARVGAGLVGIVDRSRWRVIANFKENVASKLEPGHPVWLWLDSDPWHIWKGKVQGVGRGISRRADADALLPYVAPTTDWIRLLRRLPVTILLDPSDPAPRLFMGADARVFLWR